MTFTQEFLDAFRAAMPTGEPNECWLWTGPKQSKGYGKFNALGQGDTTHRLSYLVFNGPIPKGLVVRHTCDVRLCVNPGHLILGTHKDNTQDAVERGRLVTPSAIGWTAVKPQHRARGSRNNKAKLDEAKVLSIRQRHAQGSSMGSLAKEYGVSRQAIGFIIRRETWTHVG